MKPIALFVVGAPGVGKTTLVRKILGFPRSIVALIEKPKWTLTGNVAAAGHYTGGTFDGADMVPYNGAAAALDYWEQELVDKYALTIFDGDRFSNANALQRIERRADARAVHLVGTPELLARHRAARGSNQNAIWMKGRETKALRFATGFDRLVTVGVDDDHPWDMTALSRAWSDVRPQPEIL